MSTQNIPGRRALAPFPTPPRRVVCWLLGTSFAFSVAVDCKAAGDDLPSGASLVSGNVTVSTSSPRNMLIEQGSDRAVMDWQRFDIGAHASVLIRQPSRDAILVNRVTGDAISTMAGSLGANGNVLLINPNGVDISDSARIQAHGFLASTEPLLGDADGTVTLRHADRLFARQAPLRGVDDDETNSTGNAGPASSGLAWSRRVQTPVRLLACQRSMAFEYGWWMRSVTK